LKISDLYYSLFGWLLVIKMRHNVLKICRKTLRDRQKTRTLLEDKERGLKAFRIAANRWLLNEAITEENRAFLD